MKTLVIFFCLISQSMFLTAKDYQLINPDRTAYFENAGNNVKCLKIDSVKYAEDTEYYPSKNIQELDGGCFSIKTASWIGSKIVDKGNGINLFFNKNMDTIRINTKAKINEKWIAFELKDSLIIEAEIVKDTLISRFDLMDSAKIIRFKTYDKSMNPIEMKLNNMHLIISKNYGLAVTLNFFLFPDFRENIHTDEIAEYNLIGLSNPAFGVQNLTWFDVFDFQKNDEIHITDNESTVWSDNNYLISISKEIYKYLDRIDNQDSIIYKYSRIQTISNQWADSSSFKYFNDTLQTTIKRNLAFEKLPGEPIIENDYLSAYSMQNDRNLYKIEPGYDDKLYSQDDSCWNMMFADGCFVRNEYIKGLGGPYFNCGSSMGFGFATRELVYYKKGDDIWGHPLTITGIQNREVTNNIDVYPNPAHDYLIIETNSMNSTFYIYDVSARKVKTEIINSEKSKIDISNMKAGVYFYRLTNNMSILKTGKLLIK